MEFDDGVKLYSAETGALPDGTKLNCGYWPVTEDGNEEIPEDDLNDEPEDLLGKDIYFRVDINGAEGLPGELCKDTFVTYQFKHEPDKKFSTEIVKGKNPNPTWDYKVQHCFDKVDDYMLDYIKHGEIIVKTWGTPDFGEVPRDISNPMKRGKTIVAKEQFEKEEKRDSQER